MQWEPIETAPKDGMQMLGCYLKEGFSVAVIFWWSSEDQAWETYGRKIPPVTHWMPLPAPPTKQHPARRPQVVQVKPTSKQVVLGAAAILGQPKGTAYNRDPNWEQAVEQAERAYLAMLAAAPNPPEKGYYDKGY